MGTFGLQIAFLAVHTAVSLMYRSAGYWVTSRHGWVCVGRVGSSSISSKRAVLHPGQVYLTLAGKGLIGEHRSRKKSKKSRKKTDTAEIEPGTSKHSLLQLNQLS
jgi:hypothetical protein